MKLTILHTAIGRHPHWYVLEKAATPEKAIRRANQYALDHGGYVCVKDGERVIFGTDPDQLSLAILAGINRDFRLETARRAGCCVQ